MISNKFWTSNRATGAIKEVNSAVKYLEKLLNEVEDLVVPFETVAECFGQDFGDLEAKKNEWLDELQFKTQKIAEDFALKRDETRSAMEALAPGKIAKGLVDSLVAARAESAALSLAKEKKQEVQLERFVEETASKDNELARLIEDRREIRGEEERLQLEAKEEIQMVNELTKTAEQLKLKSTMKAYQDAVEFWRRDLLAEAQLHVDGETAAWLDEEELSPDVVVSTRRPRRSTLMDFRDDEMKEQPDESELQGWLANHARMRKRIGDAFSVQ